MAKDKQLPDQPQTMEDYLLSQLEEQAKGRLGAEGAGRPRDDDDRFERSR